MTWFCFRLGLVRRGVQQEVFYSAQKFVVMKAHVSVSLLTEGVENEAHRLRTQPMSPSWLVAKPRMKLSMPALLSLSHTMSQVPASKVWSMWHLQKETELQQVLKAPSLEWYGIPRG